MLDKLGCRVGLSFVGAIKGTKRPVRKQAGGVIVLGDGDLPVKLHGKDRIDGDDHNEGAYLHRSCSTGADHPRPRGRSDANRDTRTTWGTLMPSTTDVFSTHCHQEDISFTKVSRADWIRTSDLLTPSQTRYQTALRPECPSIAQRPGTGNGAVSNREGTLLGSVRVGRKGL